MSPSPPPDSLVANPLFLPETSDPRLRGLFDSLSQELKQLGPTVGGLDAVERVARALYDEKGVADVERSMVRRNPLPFAPLFLPCFCF